MKKLITIVSLIIIVAACQDQDPVNPSDELSLDYGDLKEATLYATADSFIIDERVNTYNSIKLSIGNYQNFEAAILLKFIDIPDSGTVIDSMAFEFSTLGALGTVTADMPVSIFKVDEEWFENANAIDKWHNYNPTEIITSIQIPSEDSSRIKVIIQDTSVIREWIDDGIFNTGMYLKCTDPGVNYMREIASTEYPLDELNPMITIRYWDAQDSLFVTDTTRLGMDATIFDNNSDILTNAKNQNELLVASGVGATAYIQFDELSSLPKNAIVQKAELFIPVLNESFINPAETNGLDNMNNSQGFFVNVVLDTGDVLQTTEIDSIYMGSVSLANNDTLVQTNSNLNRANLGKLFIQNIINGDIVSEWFSISYRNKGQDLSIKRFYKTANNPARLKVKYFEVKQSGF